MPEKLTVLLEHGAMEAEDGLEPRHVAWEATRDPTKEIDGLVELLAINGRPREAASKASAAGT